MISRAVITARKVWLGRIPHRQPTRYPLRAQRFVNSVEPGPYQRPHAFWASTIRKGVFVVVASKTNQCDTSIGPSVGAAVGDCARSHSRFAGLRTSIRTAVIQTSTSGNMGA